MTRSDITPHVKYTLMQYLKEDGECWPRDHVANFETVGEDKGGKELSQIRE